MMSSEEFIKRLLDEMSTGQVTIAHLRAVKVFAEKEDDLLVVILLSGVANKEGSQGMAFAAKPETVVELITQLARGLVELRGADLATAGDPMEMKIDLGKYLGDHP